MIRPKHLSREPWQGVLVVILWRSGLKRTRGDNISADYRCDGPAWKPHVKTVPEASLKNLRGDTGRYHPLNGQAGLTRLELATSDVTGRRSNQLNYSPARKTGDEPAVTMAHPDDCAACSEVRWRATIAR
jgi:hypothetical protein